MAKVISKYESVDGKQFDTAAECDAHDAGIKNVAVIEAYITTAGLIKAGAGMLRKHLPAFIAFEAAYEAPAATPTSDENPSN